MFRLDDTNTDQARQKAAADQAYRSSRGHVHRHDAHSRTEDPAAVDAAGHDNPRPDTAPRVEAQHPRPTEKTRTLTPEDAERIARADLVLAAWQSRASVAVDDLPAENAKAAYRNARGHFDPTLGSKTR